MRKVLFCIVVTIAMAWASPGWAHEEISPSTLVVGKPVFLELSAANEENSAVTRVTLTAPESLALGGATRPPPGWSAQRAQNRITWSGGSLPPGSFETWGFEIDSPGQPGPARFSVSLGLADGSEHDSEVVVVVVGETVAGTATTLSGGSPPASTGTTVGAVEITQADPSAEGAESGSSAEGADSGDSADAALPVAIAALAVALGAAAYAATARRRAAATAPPPGDTGAPGEGQDW